MNDNNVPLDVQLIVFRYLHNFYQQQINKDIFSFVESIELEDDDFYHLHTLEQTIYNASVCNVYEKNGYGNLRTNV